MRCQMILSAARSARPNTTNGAPTLGSGWQRRGVSANVAVPEPATLVLLMIVASVVISGETGSHRNSQQLVIA